MTIERTALCGTRPTLDEVQRIVEPLGFSLGFHMAEKKAKYLYTVGLAAQYHFGRADGTEVIYFAGPDYSDSRVKHQSRFWVYGGASPPAAHEAMDTLAHAYALAWCDIRPDEDAA